MENNRSNIYKIALIGVMTAVICILAPISIPIGVVPVSLTTFAIFLTVSILGWKMGTLSYLIYLLAGIVGLPVFSGFSGGIGKLAGPTGGYLIGFIFMAIVSGIMIEKSHGKIYFCVGAMMIGSVITDVFGTVWLAYQLHLSFGAALSAGVIPFVPGDLIKIAAAAIIAPVIKKQLIKAHVL